MNHLHICILSDFFGNRMMIGAIGFIEVKYIGVVLKLVMFASSNSLTISCTQFSTFKMLFQILLISINITCIDFVCLLFSVLFPWRLLISVLRSTCFSCIFFAIFTNMGQFSCSRVFNLSNSFLNNCTSFSAFSVTI